MGRRILISMYKLHKNDFRKVNVIPNEVRNLKNKT